MTIKEIEFIILKNYPIPDGSTRQLYQMFKELTPKKKKEKK